MEFIAIGIAAIVVIGLGLNFLGSNRRTMKKTPKTRIADATEGVPVRITGVVELGDDVLNAPHSGRACAAFRLIVKREEVAATGHASAGAVVVVAPVKMFKKVLDVTETRAFLVRDESGVAIVRTDALAIDIDFDDEDQTGGFGEPSAGVKKLLDAAYVDTKKPWEMGNYRLRIREGVIEEGETVTVAGRGRFERGVGGERRLVMEAIERDGEVLVTDLERFHG